jgi:hypothetical protein
MGGKLKWLHERLIFIMSGEKLWAMCNAQSVQVRFFNYFDNGLNVLNLNLWFCLGICPC